MKSSDDKLGFFERPKTRRWLWVGLWLTCVLTVVAELFVRREPHFKQEGFFGFFAVLGFLACVAMIVLAKGLGRFLKVHTKHYDQDDSL